VEVTLDPAQLLPLGVDGARTGRGEDLDPLAQLLVARRREIYDARVDRQHDAETEDRPRRPEPARARRCPEADEEQRRRQPHAAVEGERLLDATAAPQLRAPAGHDHPAVDCDRERQRQDREAGPE
jgi:hypothetical protein